MGLAKLQGVLAQLYTDDRLRERFYADPQTTCRALGLNPDQAKQLSQVSSDQIKFFAQSLKRKRLNEVRKLLPLTCRVLGKRFGALFLRYADTYVPCGLRKHLEDAITFARFTELNAQAERIEPWTLDLLRYETAWLEALNPARKWMLRWFRHPVGMLARSVAEKNEIPLTKEQFTVAFWFRIQRRARMRHILFPLSPLRDGIPRDHSVIE